MNAPAVPSQNTLYPDPTDEDLGPIPEAHATQPSALKVPFSLSVLTVTKGSASKRLLAGANGLPIKGQGSQAITAGMLEHVEVAGLEGLQALLATIPKTQALVHGVVKGSRPGDVASLVTTEVLKQAKPGTLAPGTVARSLEYIGYPTGIHTLMFDYDDSLDEPITLTSAEDLFKILATILPGIADAGTVVTRSTSSAIRAKTTNEWLVKPKGFHAYMLVQGDVRRFVDLLKIRLWNAGHGYCKLATPNAQTGVAAILERAVIDLSVFSPERLDYVAGALIAKSAPFYQDRGEPKLTDGGVLDLDAFPDVTDAERTDYQERLLAAKAALAPERFRVVTAAIAAADAALDHEQVEALAHERLAHHKDGHLPPDFLLYFSHRKKAVAVTDLSIEYDGLRVADPAEPTYRDGTDAIFHWRGGDWLINSFAHGQRQTYRAVPVPPPDPGDEDVQDLLKRAAMMGRNGSTPGPEPPLPLSDYTNALALVRDHADDVRYCEAWKKWLHWTGTHWSYKTQGPVLQKAKQTIKRLLREAEQVPDAALPAWMAHIKRSLSTAALKAMVESAQNEPPLPLDHEQLNRQPWLLPCHNGTLDLKTGMLRPHARQDLLTECLTVAYDDDAVCPRWEAFLWQILGGTNRAEDTEGMSSGALEERSRLDTQATSLRDYLQRVLGSCLTGDVSEQDLYVFYGVGANGKSTLLGILLTLLGHYAMKAAPELLMASQDSDRHPTERADLFGKRCVAAIETQEGRRINEALVKEFTGGDPIRARRMREDFWEFLPTHKIILATNHKPSIRGTDHAIWRRVKLIPFTVIIPDDAQDKDLPTTLQEELPGILAWLVRGCLDWQRGGLRTPAIVLEATAQYRQEEDVFEEFLETECFRAPSATCASADLYEVYTQWCQANDKERLNKTRFGKRLAASGFLADVGTGGRRLWRGVGLPSTPQEDRRVRD